MLTLFGKTRNNLHVNEKAVFEDKQYPEQVRKMLIVVGCIFKYIFSWEKNSSNVTFNGINLFWFNIYHK